MMAQRHGLQLAAQTLLKLGSDGAGPFQTVVAVGGSSQDKHDPQHELWGRPNGVRGRATAPTGCERHHAVSFSGRCWPYAAGMPPTPAPSR